MFSGRLLKILCVGGFLFSTMIVSAQAQQGLFPSPIGAPTDPSKLYSTKAPEPDINSIPALANLVRAGVKLYHLGERSGVHGWLIVKNGQIQMIYLTPDKQSVIIGGLFSAQGENVTSPQIQNLMETNGDIKALFNRTADQQKEIVQAGGMQGGAASVPGGTMATPGKDPAVNIPVVPVSPGERLIQDMKAAAGVVLGESDKAELYMLAAPGCPNCKTTWKELRDSVMAKKIQVRLVPVYNTTGESEKNVSALLLKAANPLDAWDRFVQGDTSALTGTPDPLAIRAVESNLSLVAKWNIQGYPYLVYRGQDGRVKIVQGKPERMAAVLSDLSR